LWVQPLVEKESATLGPVGFRGGNCSEIDIVRNAV
jgi:hypothetical protein